MKKITLKGTLLAFVLSLVLLAGCGADSPAESSDGQSTESQSEDGQTSEEVVTDEADQASFTNLSSFTAQTLEGKEFTQENFADADLTVINVWATTCPPCIQEMPALADFEKSLPDNVKMITICLDGGYEENTETVQKIIDESGFQGATLITGDGDLATFAGELMYTPTTVFVDSQGNMVGEEIIGASEHPETVYTEHINAALESMGKEVIR